MNKVKIEKFMLKSDDIRYMDLPHETGKLEFSGGILGDVRFFLESLPFDVWYSNISMVDDGEIILEFDTYYEKCIMQFYGDGMYDYALYKDGMFYPGEDFATIDQKAPLDLMEYLKNFEIYVDGI